MSVILILILASLLMATIFLAGFIWSVRSGQYDDTTTPSMRVLMDGENAGNQPDKERKHPVSESISKSNP
jgi:cbb3-type cytochrome oxidase maturation protein